VLPVGNETSTTVVALVAVFLKKVCFLVIFNAKLLVLTMSAPIPGPIIIKWLEKMNFGQIIRKDHVEELHELHEHKQGTPTMGGILILFAVISSTLLWARLDNKFILIGLIGIIWLGLLGFIDDMLMIKNKHNKGLKARAKLLGQIILGCGIGLYLYHDPQISSAIYVPFVKNAVCNFGIFYILFVTLVIVGSSNAESKEILWKFIQRFHPDIKPKDYPVLDQLTEYAINYFRDKVEPNKRYKIPNADEKKALINLAKKLEPIAQDLKPEDIQTVVYSTGKENGYEKKLRVFILSLNY
jgi:hypothetical protein